MRMLWSLLLCCVALAGCSIRKEEATDNPIPIDPDKKMFALDPTRVYLAEKSSDLASFDRLLKAAGESHSYHQWNESFLKETMVAVTELQPGEALEEMFYAESERGLEEVQIKLIKKEKDEAILRLTCSNPDLAAEMQADLNQALGD